mmetsp:Transcript_118299/g.346554  ORF Transcript_118299/g.346554 Transcript_118299/m.346554 type:complete len:368 (-) Transcript_118299:670-1773(-)
MLVVHGAHHAVPNAKWRCILRSQPLMKCESAEETHTAHTQQSSPSRGTQFTNVVDLPTSLRIEGCPVQNDAHGLAAVQLVRALDKAIFTEDSLDRSLWPDVHLILLRVDGRIHITRGQPGRLLRHELQGAHAPLQGLLLAHCLPRALLLLLHGCLEALRVHRHACLFRHLLRQVQREPVRVVEEEGTLSRHHLCTLLVQLTLQLREVLDTALHRPVEGGLLLSDRPLHQRRLLVELWVGRAERLHDHRHQLAEEAGWRLQHLAAIAHGPPQDAAQHVAAALVRGQSAVRQRKRQRPRMVDDDAVGRVAQALVSGADEALVGLTADEPMNGVQQGHEKVRVVVAPLVLENGGDPLKPHAGVDVLARQL